MSSKWRFFSGAAIVVAYLLISHGVPVIPVLLGCGAAAIFTWRQVRRETAHGS